MLGPSNLLKEPAEKALHSLHIHENVSFSNFSQRNNIETNLFVNHLAVLDVVRRGGGRGRSQGRHDLVLGPPTLRLNTIVGLEAVLDHVILDAEATAAEIAQERFFA